MQDIFSEDRLRLAARLYYLDGLGQREIAQFVRVSQSNVSRLLARAREKGIVRITVADYEPRHGQLEDELRSRFGLATAVVIKSFESEPGSGLRRAVGHFASAVLDTLIYPQDTVAVAGGRTILELVRNLPRSRNQALTIVQAMGSVDPNASAVDAHEIARVMAERLGGTFVAFNSPVFLGEKSTRDALLRLPQLKEVQSHLNRARLALVGIGTLKDSIFLDRGALRADDIAQLQQAGAVAEICGRFYNAAGDECDTPWRDRVMGIEAARLRAIPRVVGVVSGPERAAALAAAIRGHLLNGLVIDEAGARGLLARTETGGRAASAPAAPTEPAQ